MLEIEVWRPGAGKRGLEAWCRKAKFGGREPESEVWSVRLTD